MRKIFFSVLMLMLLVTIISNVHAQTPQETLAQYIADLQKNPNDNNLREKIIRYTQTMKPAPLITEDAERYMARGGAAAEAAKNEKDFQDAVAEFEKASIIAPWVPAVYYNLGITQDKAGRYKEAIRNLKLYLLAAPDASDAKTVKNLVYKIEYRQEKASKESSPAAIAEKKRDPFEELLRKIDGRRYLSAPVSGDRAVIDVRGRVFVLGAILKGIYYESGTGWTPSSPIEIRGRETTIPIRHKVFTAWVSTTYIISEDGDRITGRARYSDGEVREDIYLWQR